MACICSSISEVSSKRLSDWDLESSEGSFTYMSSNSCLLLVRDLGSSPQVFLHVVSSWASLGSLIVWWMGSTGDHFKKEPERERGRERQGDIEPVETILFFLS